VIISGDPSNRGHSPAKDTSHLVLVSLHEPDARPIAKGRLGRPVEFGYKAQVVDNDDGIVLDHTVYQATRPTRRNSPRRSGG
jgi:IS5 family transposase